MANDCWNYLTITGRPIDLHKVYNQYFKQKAIDHKDFVKIKHKAIDKLIVVMYSKWRTDMKLVEELSLNYGLDIVCDWDIEYGQCGSGYYHYWCGDLIQNNKRRRLD